jgi:Tol biopolymer transport system component
MTSPNASRDDFDRLMGQWMEADARVREPEHLLDSVLERISAARQIPRWLLPERWLPVQLTTRFRAGPRLAPVILLLALLLALAALVATVGSRRELPAPFGLAGNGRIAYLSAGQIFTSEPDGSDPLQLTSDGAGAATPIWSIDGTRVSYKAFSSESPPGDPATYADLIVVDADGRNRVTIATKLGGLSPALWSPDDRYLLYSHGPDPSIEQVFVAPADGSSPPVRVGDPTTSNWGPSWSPDGSMIAYVSHNSIFVMNRDGTNLRQVSHGFYQQQSGIAWSPLGGFLLFVAGPPGNHDLLLVGLDGKPERAIALGPTDEESPAFSADGKWLAFLRGSTTDGSTSVVVVRTADWTEFGTMPGRYGWLGPIWSPDGTKLIVGDDRRRPPIYFLLDPFGSAEPLPLDLSVEGQPADLANLSEIPAWQRTAP